MWEGKKGNCIYDPDKAVDLSTHRPRAKESAWLWKGYNIAHTGLRQSLNVSSIQS